MHWRSEGWNSRKYGASSAGRTPDEEHFDTQVSSFDSVDAGGWGINKVWSRVAYIDKCDEQRRSQRVASSYQCRNSRASC
jgi:hypothetical protein